VATASNVLDRVVTHAGRVLEAARAGEIDEIVALESRPDMQAYVASWSRERHLRNLADPNWRYLVLRRPAGTIEGFAILSDILSAHRWLNLERIIMEHHGSGLGSDVVRGVVDAVFAQAEAHRLQLDVYEDNTRARRTYEAAGFVEEGVLRDAVWRGDRYVSLVVMSVLSSDRVAAQRR